MTILGRLKGIFMENQDTPLPLGYTQKHTKRERPKEIGRETDRHLARSLLALAPRVADTHEKWRNTKLDIA